MTESEDKRSRRGGHGKARWLCLAVVLVLLVGHASNIVGLQDCERQVLRWYARAYRVDEPLRYPEEFPPDMFLQGRLSEAGIKYRIIYPSDGARPKLYPTCRMGYAQAICPFVVTVYLEHTEGDLAGAGGRVYLLNFFGASIVVWHQRDWVS